MSKVPRAESLIDLGRYPILDLAGASGRWLLEDCRRQMEDVGACLLPGFVRPEAVVRLAEEADVLAPLAHHNHNDTTNPYQRRYDTSFPEGHPRRCRKRSSVHVLAYDLLPPGNGVRVLYEWEPLCEFVARVVGETRLHRYEDPLAGVNIAVNEDGDCNGWHFDQCDFVTSLLIREAESGGVFEFAPNLRSADDECYEAVAAVLRGESRGVRRLAMTAGALAIFKGRYSMHRVTEISGRRPRLVALLGYDTRPGVFMSEEARLRRFGRLE